MYGELKLLDDPEKTLEILKRQLDKNELLKFKRDIKNLDFRENDLVDKNKRNVQLYDDGQIREEVYERIKKVFYYRTLEIKYDRLYSEYHYFKYVEFEKIIKYYIHFLEQIEFLKNKKMSSFFQKRKIHDLIKKTNEELGNLIISLIIEDKNKLLKLLSVEFKKNEELEKVKDLLDEENLDQNVGKGIDIQIYQCEDDIKFFSDKKNIHPILNKIDILEIPIEFLINNPEMIYNYFNEIQIEKKVK